VAYREKDIKKSLEILNDLLNEISHFYGIVYEQLGGKRKIIVSLKIKKEYEPRFQKLI